MCGKSNSGFQLPGFFQAFCLSAVFAVAGCGGSGSSSGDSVDPDTLADDTLDNATDSETVDITDTIFSETSVNCADYINSYGSSVLDETRSLGFEGDVLITGDDAECTLVTNNIPNHNFNDASANFATDVSEVMQSFTVTRTPALAAGATALSQTTYNGIMLNGVPIDILSAGCYSPDDPQADADGNVHIGCTTDDDWLLDPLGTDHKFGADQHNAHTQPDGSYHYHGNPNAMFDDAPGPNGSPVIGFAADGFPIYGSYFLDPDSGQVRKALSGYTLKTGQRPSSASDPGGDYDGTYVQDWEFADAGDLDACNGITVNGQYSYYVTDSYPWLIDCLSGTPHESFDKF